MPYVISFILIAFGGFLTAFALTVAGIPLTVAIMIVSGIAVLSVGISMLITFVSR